MLPYPGPRLTSQSLKVQVFLVKSEKLCSLGKLSGSNSGNFAFIQVFIAQTFLKVYYGEAAG